MFLFYTLFDIILLGDTMGFFSKIKNMLKGSENTTEIEEKEVYCDATEIERIIVNLLSNAVKFTPKGGKITVLIMDKGEKVEIIVEDTGTGISKEDQEFIFNRFEQGQNRKFTNISSSGIGLTLVKYLVELHNGEIRLESEVGKGSKFIISLPVK